MPYEIAPTSSFATEEHVQEHLEGLLEDGHDEDEMKEFIETHGNSDFLCYYEDYARMVDEYDQETVTHFLKNLISWMLNTYKTHTWVTMAAEKNLRSHSYLTWVTL